MIKINGALYRKGLDGAKGTYYHFLGRVRSAKETLDLGLNFVEQYHGLAIPLFDHITLVVNASNEKNDETMKEKISYILKAPN
ncbi:MAG: hypothetical protein V1802_03330 [Candidatus Aenigmatarchaeota archaeon]